MRDMTMGSNASLTALSENVGSAIVSLGWSSPTGEGDADVSVLLLDGNGKVRSDADFYFYNNPVAADGSVQLLGKEPTGDGSEDRISFDLTAVPAEVERIVVAASRYEGARFGELDDLKVTLADAVGESLLRFVIEDAGQVSAIIFGELYRRGEEWKFRAVGKGYESGLAGLGDLLPKDSSTRIIGFRLSLFKSMGSGRGSAESGFIRSVDDAVHRFHTSVVAHLDAPASGRTATKERATVGRRGGAAHRARRPRATPSSPLNRCARSTSSSSKRRSGSSISSPQSSRIWRRR